MQREEVERLVETFERNSQQRGDQSPPQHSLPPTGVASSPLGARAPSTRDARRRSGSSERDRPVHHPPTSSGSGWGVPAAKGTLWDDKDFWVNWMLKPLLAGVGAAFGMCLGYAMYDLTLDRLLPRRQSR